MQLQNYKNHIKIVPVYHYFILITGILVLIGSVVNLYKRLHTGEGLYSASLILVMALVLLGALRYLRLFALRAQDRVIRAEENFRHYLMTGKVLDPRLTIRQIIGLRFASDEEYLDLINRAITENLSEKEIKLAIKNWRGDYYRV